MSINFSEFADTCTKLSKISGRLDKIELLSEVIKKLSVEDLPIFVRLLLGKPFPDYSPLKLGIGPNLIYEAVSYVTGKRRDSVVNLLNKVGDMGSAVEELLSKKSQTSFFMANLTLADVYMGFEEISGKNGAKSQKDKIRVIERLLSDANPSEGHYITNILLEDMRIGAGENNLRDAVSKAFLCDVSSVEHAQQILNDMGEVALLAKAGEDKLNNVKMSPFRPVKMMLARQGSIVSTLEISQTLAVEYKYDGTRFQFHKKNGECRMYSRRLEEVTSALPDVIKMLDEATEHDVIIDGEVIAIQDGRPLPFQNVLRRFRRKHDVDGMKDEVNLIPNVFDILWLDGKTLIDLPFSERRELLVSNISRYVTPQFVSSDEEEIERYYHQALDDGHEGVMLKLPGSHYTPGVRGKDWIKIKPEVDTLDLVVIGADWGEGKRAGLFGSFLLGAWGELNLIPVSRVATGFSDDDLASFYEILKDEVKISDGKSVFFEPLLVIEVGYSEIQKSSNYESGYALRFPRFIRVRDDKDMTQANTVADIEERFRIVRGDI